MRLNRFIASALGVGRRKADDLIAEGRIKVDSAPAKLGERVTLDHSITLDGKRLKLPEGQLTVIVNKPKGVVVSKKGQGSQTIYDILPTELSRLNPVGRLDKDSTGLLLMTSDGVLLNKLAHPAKGKIKEYLVMLDKPLTKIDLKILSSSGVSLEDGVSRLNVSVSRKDESSLVVKMHEGRNRQIRRTFAALGYRVMSLHRYKFGEYTLGDIKPGKYRAV